MTEFTDIAQNRWWGPRLVWYLWRRRNRPFRWGSNDCVTLANAAARLQNGLDLMRLYPEYRSGHGARSIIAKNGGHTGLLDRVMARLDKTRDGCIVMFEGRAERRTGAHGWDFLYGVVYRDRVYVPTATGIAEIDPDTIQLLAGWDPCRVRTAALEELT